MNFKDNSEEAKFRKEVRDFVQTEVKSDERMEDMERGMYRGAFERLKDLRGKLSKKGWIAPAWPKEYGGAGLSVMQQFIMNEEFAENRVPPVGGMGVSMVGPTLIVHGNEEQKKEHLGRILSGEVQWCQGFSEPGSGSDLASLQTRAVRDGDDFVINGQKIWTSGAQYAHWMFMMASTDPDAPKHKGISYFLVDMKSPGVEVRPLTNLANQNMFNEVFFQDVRVPARNLVGEENRGWYIGATTLDFERSSIAASTSMALIVRDLAAWVRDAGRRLRAYQRSELAERAVEAEIGRLLSYQVISLQKRGMIP